MSSSVRWRVWIWAMCMGLACGLHAAPLPQTEDFSQFDNAQWASVLRQDVDTRGDVDYAGLKNDRGALDLHLRAVGELEEMTYNAWTGGGKLAFWINTYNAIVLKHVIDHYPILSGGAANSYPANSVRQIAGMFNRLRVPVMGKPMSLDEIEHEMLRKQFKDARIHVALVCGTRGAPPLHNEPYDGRRLDEQLLGQAQRMLADPTRMVALPVRQVVRISPIFQWFGADFVPTYETQAPPDANPRAERAVLWFLGRTLDDLPWERIQHWQVEYLPYDWSLNEAERPLATSGVAD